MAAAAAVAGAALGFSLLGGGPVERPGPPGSGLAEQLGSLRGANDLVRATRADVGRDPALYPTAYGRMEALLGAGGQGGEPVPAVRLEALADLARTDVLDGAAWQAYYVCLALTDAGGTMGSRRSASADARKVLDRAGLRQRAEAEALAYLRTPDGQDDLLTSVATRAAFLGTVTCLGREAEVPRAALDRLAADAARVDQPVPALYAVEALRGAGARATAGRALQDARRLRESGCAAHEPIQRAALTLLSRRLTRQTRDCLLPALRDPDTQTRWLVRRALTLDGARTPESLPAPGGEIRADGLVPKSPLQMGTLTATYNAARALTASGRQQHVPDWLTSRLRQLGADPGLDPSDRLLLAMTCHRLSVTCGPQAGRGAEEAAELTVPERLSRGNERRWYGAMAARAEFGLGCRAAPFERPAHERTALSASSLRIAAVLAEAGCADHAERLTRGVDLVGQARTALRNGDLLSASDAVQAALGCDRSVPQEFWADVPRLLDRYRDPKYPDLYAATPGGAASADATRAAYLLLA
ncbi:hypothetical protein [Streptomyces sp. NPDC127114]|uniref:hypothetical protein n=1 Tax=Streptomyces sp. NPDC127114 TaxID=3345366 RepID=UPI003639FCC4